MENKGPAAAAAAAGLSSVPSNQNSQRRFFHWAMQWFHAGRTEDIIVKPDAPELACFLQAIGFQLKEFDKQDELLGAVDKIKKTDSLKVIIECSSSKMRAVMELDEIDCRCPNQDDAKDASFWSVSGTGPLGSTENMNKVVETGSNLLPSLSKGDASVIRDVTNHILKLIRSIPDFNQNTDKNFNISDNYENNCRSLSSNNERSNNTLTRRHTQPDFNTARCRSLDALIETGETSAGDKIKNSSSSSTNNDDILINLRNRSSSDSTRRVKNDKLSSKSNGIEKGAESIDNNDSSSVILSLNPPPLRRQRTFDMDTDNSNMDVEPRPSPPKISSSPVPVPQLCSSLGQISLQSEGKEAPLVELLFHAKANLENALKLINSRSRASSTTVEDVFLMPPPSSSFKLSPGDNYRPESSCSLPIQSGIRSSGLQRAAGSSSSARRNVEESFRRVSEGVVKSPIDRKSISGNKNILQRRSLGGRMASPKSMMGVKAADTPRPGVNSGSAMSRMIIAAKRRVSPDPKINSPKNQNKANKSLNTSTGIRSFVGSNKYQGNSIATGTGSTKSQITASNSANKFGFIRKKD